MSEPFVAQIMIFGFTFAPRGYAFCAGQILPISQNDALFSLVGTTYGGDGRTTFGLPNLQARGVMNYGHGPGLSDYRLGEPSGQAAVTLTQAQIPHHQHNAFGSAGSQEDVSPPANGWLGEKSEGSLLFSNAAVDTTLNSAFLERAGDSLSHPNQQPYLAMNYCIALYGVYPSRN